MLANYHTHTVRCGHAVGEDKAYVENAIANGMKILGFSEHCPWVFPYAYRSDMRLPVERLDDYFTSLLDLKKAYADDIRIYIGFESEYFPTLLEAQKQLLADYPVDYMILGQHFSEPEPYGEYAGNMTLHTADLKQYVDTVIAGMETGLYRYVAHPDLLHFRGTPVTFEREYERLCQYLKEKGIPIEINLLGLVHGRHYPSGEFLKIAERVGNKAIIGVDAHAPEMLNDKKGQAECRALAEQYHLELVETLEGLE